MSMDDAEAPPTMGRADIAPPADDDDLMLPAFLMPDPESISGWRYFHIKHKWSSDQKPGRRMGFR